MSEEREGSGESRAGIPPATTGRAKVEAARFLAFTLCGEQYAVPLLKVKEVIGLTEITPVPYTPTHFKGIMNLRGQVISVIDLRLKFSLPTSSNGSETAIIILDLSPLSLGVIVDSIDSVLGVDVGDIQPTPDIDSRIGTDYISGVIRNDKRLVLLLDIERALSVAELKTIRRAAQSQTDTIKAA